MNCYFFSKQKYALKFNGNFLGVTNTQPVKTEVDFNTPPLIELCALENNSPAITFILTEDFLKTPSKSVNVADMQNAYFIMVKNNYATEELKIIRQQKFYNVLVTVFCENGYKISIETPQDFYCESTDFKINSANFEFIFNNRLLLIAVNDSPTILKAYSLNNKIQKVLDISADSYSVEKGLSVTETFSDISKHSVTGTFEWNNEKLIVCKTNVESKQQINLNDLPKDLFPFAFAEEFLTGGDYKVYLSEDLLNKTQKLKQYLGNYIGVCPPTKDCSISGAGLIYKTSLNTYKVKYLTVNVEDNKIVNLQLHD